MYNEVAPVFGIFGRLFGKALEVQVWWEYKGAWFLRGNKGTVVADSMKTESGDSMSDDSMNRVWSHSLFLISFSCFWVHTAAWVLHDHQYYCLLFATTLNLQARIALLNTALTAIGMWILDIPGIAILSMFVFLCRWDSKPAMVWQGSISLTNSQMNGADQTHIFSSRLDNDGLFVAESCCFLIFSFIPIAGCILSTVPIGFVALTGGKHRIIYCGHHIKWL